MSRTPSQIGSCVFLRREGEVLLAMKKRGFGVGKWNGPGGKPDAGETPKQAAVRECHEEIDVVIHERALALIARIRFHYPYKDEFVEWDGYMYECWDWTGEPKESEEMAPEWFRLAELPLHEMWDDDNFWLIRALGGERLRWEFEFDQNDMVSRHAEQKLID